MGFSWKDEDEVDTETYLSDIKFELGDATKNLFKLEDDKKSLMDFVSGLKKKTSKELHPPRWAKDEIVNNGGPTMTDVVSGMSQHMKPGTIIASRQVYEKINQWAQDYPTMPEEAVATNRKGFHWDDSEGPIPSSKFSDIEKSKAIEKHKRQIQEIYDRKYGRP